MTGRVLGNRSLHRRDDGHEFERVLRCPVQISSENLTVRGAGFGQLRRLASSQALRVETGRAADRVIPLHFRGQCQDRSVTVLTADNLQSDRQTGPVETARY